MNENTRMYIYSLSGPSQERRIHGTMPVNIFTVHEGQAVDINTNYLAPAITTDGRIALMNIGNEKELNSVQQNVIEEASARIFEYGIKDISIGNFAVVGTSFKLVETTKKIGIYKVLVYPEPLKEFEMMYHFLEQYCLAEDSRQAIQKYYENEPRKSWINDVIANLSKKINWNNIVNDAINRAEAITKQAKIA